MALDPSISLQAGRVQPLDPIGAIGQAMNLRALAQQAQSQELQLQQQQRQMADQEAMRGAYVVGQDGRIDNAATLRNLARVNPAMAQKFHFETTQNELASLKAAREAEKQQLEVVGKRLELTRNGLAALGPNATYADAMRVAMSLRGQGVPVDVNEIPQDPAQLQQYLQEQRIQTDAIFRNYRQMTGAGSKIAELQAALQNARTPEEQQQIRNQIDIETRGQPDAAVRLDPVTGVPAVNPAAVEAKSQIARAGASNTTFAPNMGKVETSARIQANEDFQKNVYRPTMESEKVAKRSNAQIQTLRGLSVAEKTGWGAEAKSKAMEVLLGLGYKNEDASRYVADAQKFKSVVGESVWQLLAAQKGPQTEGDAKRAQDVFQSLGKLPEANAFISDVMQATNNKTIAEARFYRNNYDRILKEGDLSKLEREFANSKEGQMSIWDDPAMRKWKVAVNPTTGQKIYSKDGGNTYIDIETGAVMPKKMRK